MDRLASICRMARKMMNYHFDEIEFVLALVLLYDIPNQSPNPSR